MSRTRSRPPGRGRCVPGCVRVVYYSVSIQFVFGPDTVRDSRERVPVPLDPPTRAGPQANAQPHTSALFTHQSTERRDLRPELRQPVLHHQVGCLAASCPGPEHPVHHSHYTRTALRRGSTVGCPCSVSGVRGAWLHARDRLKPVPTTLADPAQAKEVAAEKVTVNCVSVCRLEVR